MAKYVTSQLSDEKQEDLKVCESWVWTVKKYNRQIYDTGKPCPVPWFGMKYDASSVTMDLHDVENFLAFRIESEMIYLEAWDLAGNKDIKDWEKWNKTVEISFNLVKSTPGLCVDNLMESLIRELSQYEDKFPKSVDGEPFEDILVTRPEKSDSGKGVYFCQEGDCILLKSSYEGGDTVLEVFDSGDKFGSFVDTMRYAWEQLKETEE